MKKFSLILRYISSALVVLVSLVFTILEATLLITLDFTLYEHQFIALIQIILRLLIASAALALGIFSLIKIKRAFSQHGLCLLASSVVMIPFVSNHIALYFTAVSALFLFSQLLFSKTRN